MFALFFSLYYSMFTGSWSNLSMNTINAVVKSGFDILGEFFTSIFNGVTTPMTNLGDVFLGDVHIWIVSYILALITSIGIVVMAVKGIKKVFGIFFMGIRR